MPQVYPFRAAQFKGGKGDVSDLVAPPYDVLDASGKGTLLAKDPHNIVAIDLPHTPAKELGPPEAYESAAKMYRNWLASGTLTRRATPAMFAYRQTFTAGGKTFQRSGMACAVETVPFGPREGGGILPHEETFSGPKEDRMALMKATRAQLSPIFGLHADEDAKATKLLQSVMASRPADLTANMSSSLGENIPHEIWTIEDEKTIAAYQDTLRGEDVFIADGHHRYTTGLNYLKGLEEQGKVAGDHPARRCMIVLVSMSDPGLVIWPTHRVLGGMKNYSFDSFLEHSRESIRFEPVAGDLHAIDRALQSLGGMGPMRFALYDVKSGRGGVAAPASGDPLNARFPDKPKAWRELVVAFIQYGIVESICTPKLNAGEAVKWAFPHTIDEVLQITRGLETGAGGGKVFGSTGAQLAVIVRPTPLDAVKDVSRANQLMPQKSTFFYPKIATGLFVNPLE